MSSLSQAAREQQTAGVCAVRRPRETVWDSGFQDVLVVGRLVTSCCEASDGHRNPAAMKPGAHPPPCLCRMS